MSKLIQHVLAITVMLLGLPPLADAGTWLGYPICLSMCAAACVAAFCVVGGPACIAAEPCIVACATACVCFDPDSMLQTPTGKVKASELHAGDYVLGQARNGSAVYTRIVDNFRVPGNYSFTRLSVRGFGSLSVTNK